MLNSPIWPVVLFREHRSRPFTALQKLLLDSTGLVSLLISYSVLHLKCLTTTSHTLTSGSLSSHIPILGLHWAPPSGIPASSPDPSALFLSCLWHPSPRSQDPSWGSLWDLFSPLHSHSPLLPAPPVLENPLTQEPEYQQPPSFPFLLTLPEKVTAMHTIASTDHGLRAIRVNSDSAESWLNDLRWVTSGKWPHKVIEEINYAGT